MQDLAEATKIAASQSAVPVIRFALRASDSSKAVYASDNSLRICIGSRREITPSLTLAELSTLAQAAGDMQADLANDYLIATDAAYKLKGNREAPSLCNPRMEFSVSFSFPLISFHLLRLTPRPNSSAYPCNAIFASLVIRVFFDKNVLIRLIKEVAFSFETGCIYLSYAILACSNVANAIKELSVQQDMVNSFTIGTMEWADAYGHLQQMIVNVTKDISNLQKAQSSKSLQPSSVFIALFKSSIVWVFPSPLIASCTALNSSELISTPPDFLLNFATAKIDVILDTSGTVGKTKGSIKKLAAELHNELSVEISKLQKQGVSSFSKNAHKNTPL